MNSKYTEEQKAFIRANGKGLDNAALTAAFNARFLTTFSVSSLTNIRYRLGAKSGLVTRVENAGRFKKGHVSSNKGKKRSEYMSEAGQLICAKTQFKKGHPSLNRREVGSERINVDGYIEIKVAEPNRWKAKHRWLWEKEHGDIPKGHKVIMLDGNRLNVDMSNLRLVTNGEEALLNRLKLRSSNKELTEVGIGIVKISHAGYAAVLKLRGKRKRDNVKLLHKCNTPQVE